MSWLASAASVLLVSHSVLTAHAQSTGWSSDFFNRNMDSLRYAETYPGRPDNNTAPRCQWPRGPDGYKDRHPMSEKTSADIEAARKGLEHIKSLKSDATLSDETDGRGTRMYSAKEEGVPSCDKLSATIWIFGNSEDKVPLQTGIDAVQKILDTCQSQMPDHMIEQGLNGVKVAGGSMYVKPDPPKEEWWPYVAVMRNNDAC
ncbi:MAG: hypothetical protein M1831_001228 [Alyxoria varia]|nr:MAG: hypothetical protein M1831_001228 [Alyxoria varia]